VNEKYKTKNHEPCSDFFFKCNTVKVNSSFFQGKVIEIGSSPLNQNHLQSLLWSGSISAYSATNRTCRLHSRCRKLPTKLCSALPGIASHVFPSILQISFLHHAALKNLQEKLLLRSKHCKM